MRKIILSFILILQFTNSVFSQENADDKDSIDVESKAKRFQKGYVVRKEHGDTLFGLIKIHRPLGVIESIEFKSDENAKKKPYRGDSILVFYRDGITYRHFAYCGWTELIEKGAIDIYKGYVSVAVTMPGQNTIQYCLAFKKGSQKAKFISEGETITFSGGILTQKVKNYFKEYIEDNETILADFSRTDFRFKDLQDLVKKYNKSLVKQ